MRNESIHEESSTRTNRCEIPTRRWYNAARPCRHREREKGCKRVESRGNGKNQKPHQAIEEANQKRINNTYIYSLFTVNTTNLHESERPIRSDYSQKGKKKETRTEIRENTEESIEQKRRIF